MANNQRRAVRQRTGRLLRVVARLAEVACPPELRTIGMRPELVAEFAALLEVLPRAVRWAVRGGLVALDQGARLYPRARGRRFVHLADPDAEAYLRAVLARQGGLGTAVQRIKGLLVFCYYELPEVKEQLGYRPDAYIAAVSERRLASYGPEILAGEAAVLAADPRPDAGARPYVRRGRP